jgi:ubiquitin C-terminal hydrolase
LGLSETAELQPDHNYLKPRKNMSNVQPNHNKRLDEVIDGLIGNDIDNEDLSPLEIIRMRIEAGNRIRVAIGDDINNASLSTDAIVNMVREKENQLLEVPNKDNAIALPLLVAGSQKDSSSMAITNDTAITFPRGLSNPSIYCYINVIIQLLLVIEPLSSEIIQWFKDTSESSCFALAELLQELRQGNGIHDPTQFRQLVFEMGFDRSKHQDAHELLITLLDKVCRARGNDCNVDSILQSVVEYECGASCKCPKTQMKETHIIISLPVTEKSLVGCLESEFCEETLPGFKCGECKLDGLSYTKKRKVFVAMPPFMIFQLKRFSCQGSTGEMLKDTTRVTFPTDLNLATFCRRNIDYELIAVVVHTAVDERENQAATLERGHYIMYRKMETCWVCINDARISVVNEAAVLNTQAYMLMFKKRPEGVDDQLLLKYSQQPQTKISSSPMDIDEGATPSPTPSPPPVFAGT